jgi:hypothetical protein
MYLHTFTNHHWHQVHNIWRAASCKRKTLPKKKTMQILVSESLWHITAQCRCSDWALMGQIYPRKAGASNKFFIIFNSFCKTIRPFQILQIWQPTAVRHGDLKGSCHGPRRQGSRQRSAAGSGARGSLPLWATTVGPSRRGPQRFVPTAGAASNRRGARRLVAKSTKIWSGRIVLQNELKNIKNFASKIEIIIGID